MSSIRKSTGGGRLGPLDLAKISELTFDEICRAHAALTQKAEDLLGSDLADPSSDATAKLLMAEATVLDSLIQTQLLRAKQMATMSVGAYARMIERSSLARPDTTVRVNVDLFVPDLPVDEAKQLVISWLMQGKYEFAIDTLAAYPVYEAVEEEERQDGGE